MSKEAVAAIAITKRERKVLEFVAFRIDTLGVQPSYREICEQFGWRSINTIKCMVDGLRAKGVLQNTDERAPSRGLMFRWKEYLR